MNRFGVHRCTWAMAVLTTVMLMSACGGGGGDDNNNNNVANPPATPSPEVTLSGVAATGAPIVGGAVSLGCFAGSAVGTVTDVNGAWSTPVPAANLPCLVTVTGGTVGDGAANTLELTSLAAGGGAALTVNVTPLSTLVLSGMSESGLREALFDRHETDAIGRVAEVMQTAVALLGSTLSDNGYAVPANFDPVGGVFTAAAGNPYDDLLEQIRSALTQAGKSYGDMFAGYAHSADWIAAIPYGTTAGQTGPIVFGRTGGNAVAADVAPLVGVYRGKLGRHFASGAEVVDTDSCTITVTADGTMAVEADGRSYGAAMNGDVGDLLMQVLDMFQVMASDVPNDQYVMVTVTRGYVSSAVARKGGYGFSDAVNRVECVVPDPHATTLGTATTTVNVTNGATASDLDTGWAGVYSDGSCTVTITNDAKVRVVKEDVDTEIQLAGDEDDSIYLYPTISSEAVLASGREAGGVLFKITAARSPGGLTVDVTREEPRPRTTLASCRALPKTSP